MNLDEQIKRACHKELSNIRGDSVSFTEVLANLKQETKPRKVSFLYRISHMFSNIRSRSLVAKTLSAVSLILIIILLPITLNFIKKETLDNQHREGSVEQAAVPDKQQLKEEPVKEAMLPIDTNDVYSLAIEKLIYSNAYYGPEHDTIIRAYRDLDEVTKNIDFKIDFPQYIPYGYTLTDAVASGASARQCSKVTLYYKNEASGSIEYTQIADMSNNKINSLTITTEFNDYADINGYKYYFSDSPSSVAFTGNGINHYVTGVNISEEELLKFSQSIKLNNPYNNISKSIDILKYIYTEGSATNSSNPMDLPFTLKTLKFGNDELKPVTNSLKQVQFNSSFLYIAEGYYSTKDFEFKFLQSNPIKGLESLLNKFDSSNVNGSHLWIYDPGSQFEGNDNYNCQVIVYKDNVLSVLIGDRSYKDKLIKIAENIN